MASHHLVTTARSTHYHYLLFFPSCRHHPGQDEGLECGREEEEKEGAGRRLCTALVTLMASSHNGADLPRSIAARLAAALVSAVLRAEEAFQTRAACVAKVLTPLRPIWTFPAIAARVFRPPSLPSKMMPPIGYLAPFFLLLEWKAFHASMATARTTMELTDLTPASSRRATTGIHC
jgi:hypothetical protein